MFPRRNKTAITSEDGVDTAIELILSSHRYASTGLDEANELPLHWLCRNVSATVNMVDEVWQAFPDAAAESARNGVRPIDDIRGSAEHRKEIVAVLTRRTLEQALNSAARGPMTFEEQRRLTVQVAF